MPSSPAPFLRARRVVFAIVLASYVLSFFHRTAPAAIAGELQRAFEIPAAVLGTLAATYFYVYTLLQIPVGVLADTVGPRRLLAGGSLVAGLGSLAFALAPTWEVAAAGRTLVGVGVSVAGLFAATAVATITSTTPMLALMLGLAVGIDYALFLVARHQEQLRAGVPVEESIGRATATAGSAVVFAGVLVAQVRRRRSRSD